MPGHAQYTLGPVTCIDDVVDNARVGYHQMASYFLNKSWRRKMKRRNRTSNFNSRNVRECNCLETHIPRNGHILWLSECDDYAFCKVCYDSFSIAHGRGNDVTLSVTVLMSHGHIAELNKLRVPADH